MGGGSCADASGAADALIMFAALRIAGGKRLRGSAAIDATTSGADVLRAGRSRLSGVVDTPVAACVARDRFGGTETFNGMCAALIGGASI